MNFDLNSTAFTTAIILIALWTIPWKGVALWKSARNNQIGWFIVMLILNTVGILEITYIFFFSKKKAGKKIN
jgi:methionyl-tRNA synthetase